jgi:hypothetical protein
MIMGANGEDLTMGRFVCVSGTAASWNSGNDVYCPKCFYLLLLGLVDVWTPLMLTDSGWNG